MKGAFDKFGRFSGELGVQEAERNVEIARRRLEIARMNLTSSNRGYRNKSVHTQKKYHATCPYCNSVCEWHGKSSSVRCWKCNKVFDLNY